MNTEKTLDDLKYNTGVFPRQAVKEAIANREQIAPRLLKVINEAKSLQLELYQDNYMLHIYAMYLLAQFREEQAYPLIVDFFAIPDPIVMDSTGDVVTEDLHRILASVAHGDTTLIKSLLENDKANEYVRSAALKTLLTQMVQGELTREEVVAYYQSLFRGGLEREPSCVWDDLVWYSADLYPEELMEDIRQAYKDNLIESTCIRLEDVEEALARAKETMIAELYGDSRHQFVENVIEEISWWACFAPPKKNKIKVAEEYQPISVYKTQPGVARTKIGRNEPCPCGSGKKYKKCCGK
jgi:hypothetical protein